MPSDTYTLIISEFGSATPTLGSVTNDAVASNAAIAGTKISPNFGSQNITTTGNCTATTFTGNLVGNVTGNLTGVASQASTLSTARDLTLTGNVTATLSSFNGSTNVSAVATLANQAVTFAKMQNVTGPVLLGKKTDGSVAGSPATITASDFMLGTSGTGFLATADAQAGRTALLPDQTGQANKVLQTDGTDVQWASVNSGTVTSVALSTGTTGLTVNGGSSATITSSGTFTVAGLLAVANGGTGHGDGTSPYVIGDLLYASGTSALSKLPIGTSGQVLTSSGTQPTWATLAGLLPSQSGENGKYLTTNGTTASWDTLPAAPAKHVGAANLVDFASAPSVTLGITSAEVNLGSTNTLTGDDYLAPATGEISIGTAERIALKNDSGATRNYRVTVSLTLQAVSSYANVGFELHFGESGIGYTKIDGAETRVNVNTSYTSVVLTHVITLQDDEEVILFGYLDDVSGTFSVNFAASTITLQEI
jgi:hypothetical protein